MRGNYNSQQPPRLSVEQSGGTPFPSSPLSARTGSRALEAVGWGVVKLQLPAAPAAEAPLPPSPLGPPPWPAAGRRKMAARWSSENVVVEFRDAQVWVLGLFEGVLVKRPLEASQAAASAALLPRSEGTGTAQPPVLLFILVRVQPARLFPLFSSIFQI